MGGRNLGVGGNMDRIRVLRILEYTGPREHVEKVLSQNAVKGIFHGGTVTIREAIVAPYPEILDEDPDDVCY